MLVGDDVYQAAGHHDDLAYRLAVELFLDLRRGEGCGFDRRGVGVGGDGDLVAELAVDLDHEFELVGDECGFVVSGPRQVGEHGGRRGLRQGCRSHAGVDLLAEMRGVGIEDVE